MRYFVLTLIVLCTPLLMLAQDNKEESLGLPGDNLNLYAALKLFQDCRTLEEFEKKLNSEDDKINNLDLDEDGNIDYIKVVDSVDKDVHNVVLQVDLGQGETQNVAVFVVNKEKDGATIQVIGDEDLYGKDYIIEPNYNDSGTPNPGYQGDEAVKVQAPTDGNQYQQQVVSYVQVYSWPVVQYIYHVSYVPWRSPWYWSYYPAWWRPWKPYYWHYYYGYHYHWHSWYYGYYRRGYWYRYNGWHGWYYGSSWRRRSNIYYSNYKAGNYRKTYSRPETMQEGSANFKTKFPNAAVGNNKLPDVNVPDFKPDLVKPAPKPGFRPSPGGEPIPGTKPTTGIEPVPGTRPSPETKPTTRPTTKPVTKPPTKPTPKPVTKPSTKPTPKPVPKPAPQPVPKPVPKTTRG